MRPPALLGAPSAIGIRPYDTGEPRRLDLTPGTLRALGILGWPGPRIGQLRRTLNWFMQSSTRHKRERTIVTNSEHERAESALAAKPRQGSPDREHDLLKQIVAVRIVRGIAARQTIQRRAKFVHYLVENRVAQPCM